MSHRNAKLIDHEFATPPAVTDRDDVPQSDIRVLVNQLQQTAFELRHRLSAVEDERNNLARQVEVLRPAPVKLADPPPAPAAPSPMSSASSSLDAVRQHNMELNRTVEGLRRALTESQKRLDAVQEQLANLRLARDASQAQTRELMQRLEQREHEIADLHDTLSTPPVAAHAGGEAALELTRLRATQAETNANLAAARQRIESLEAEKSQNAARLSAAQAELKAARERCAALEAASATAPAGPSEEVLHELEELRSQRRELAARLEAQRLETIDLAARFQATQEQIKDVSASLAEARLLAKAHKVQPPPTPPAGNAPILPETVPAPAPAQPAAPTPDVVVPMPVAPVSPTFPDAHVLSTLKEMRRSYQSYARQPGDLSYLNELYCITLSFAEQCEMGGAHAVNRLAAGLAVFIQELYQFPEQITNEALGTVVESIEFLSAALKGSDLRQLRLPSEMNVCVVDDDSATCECLLMGMESVGFQAGSYQDPQVALAELTHGTCDLIVLDVQMPGMDGFQLCTAIRRLPHFKRTPILFVSGQAEQANRERALQSGGNAFMAKPFMLCELGLKALLITAKAQLKMI